MQRIYAVSPRDEWAQAILAAAIDIDYEQGVRSLLVAMAAQGRIPHEGGEMYLKHRWVPESEVRDASAMYLAELERRARASK